MGVSKMLVALKHVVSAIVVEIAISHVAVTVSEIIVVTESPVAAPHPRAN